MTYGHTLFKLVLYIRIHAGGNRSSDTSSRFALVIVDATAPVVYIGSSMAQVLVVELGWVMVQRVCFYRLVYDSIVPCIVVLFGACERPRLSLAGVCG